MDTLTGARIETYWVELLDRADNRVKILSTTKGGRVEANWDRRIKTGCSLTVDNPRDIDVMKHRVRPWVRVNDQAWPLGVFVFTSPEQSFGPEGESWTFQGVDKLSILDDDKIPASWGYDTGTVVTEAVLDVIQGAGETAVALTESAGTLRTPISFEAGTPRLTIVDTLLNAIGYDPLWVDGYGQYRVQPAIPPQDRPLRRTFEQGQVAIHKPDWTRSQNVADVPNRVILRTQGTDDIPGLISVAENTDPASPYSYQARGYRWKTEFYDDEDAVDQATLDALARRRLLGWGHPPVQYRVSHAIVPIDMLDVVEFASNGYRVRASVNEWQADLSIGAGMVGLWYEVGAA